MSTREQASQCRDNNKENQSMMLHRRTTDTILIFPIPETSSKEISKLKYCTPFQLLQIRRLTIAGGIQTENSNSY
jgi:hypothetical protein